MGTTRSVWLAAGIGIFLGGCAYTTATPVEVGDMTTKGFRVFAPKTYLVATGSGVSTVVIPDCSKPFAVQFGTFLAKNEVTLKMTNSILTEVSAKEDSTALPLEFLKSVTEAAKAGKQLGDGLSDKAAGGSDEFAIWSVDCNGAAAPALTTIRSQKARPDSTPPSIPEGDAVSMPGGAARR